MQRNIILIKMPRVETIHFLSFSRCALARVRKVSFIFLPLSFCNVRTAQYFRDKAWHGRYLISAKLLSACILTVLFPKRYHTHLQRPHKNTTKPIMWVFKSSKVQTVADFNSYLDVNYFLYLFSELLQITNPLIDWFSTSSREYTWYFNLYNAPM